MVAANEKLSEARSTIEAQSKEAAAATASVTERLTVAETETAGRLGELQALVDSVATLPKARKATKPTFGSKQRRLEGKATRSGVKQLRGRVRGLD